MHRKRVPQVRAREDNLCGYRGSPGLVKMVLMRILTRDLACLAFADLLISGKSVDRFGKPVDRYWVYCSNLLLGWDSVDISAESVDRLWISVDRLLAL